MIDTLQEPQRALPHSEEAERAVLAAVLLDPPLLAAMAGRLVAEDFYGERHQILYRAMLDLQAQQVEIDLRTLQARLEQQDQLEQVGGIAYLSGLDLDLPDLGRAETYVEIVKERSLRRRLIRACGEITRDCLDGGLEAQQALGRAEEAILTLGEEAIPRGFEAIGTIAASTLADLEERTPSAMIGVETGFKDFDEMTRGLNKSNLVIIAGRPGLGKTSFALNIAQYVSIHTRKPVGVFSLEMSKQELVLRILSSESQVNFSQLRSGHLSQKQWGKVIETVREVSAAPLYIDDSASPTLLEVASKARRLKAEKGLQLIVLDYLQLMQAGGRYENRNLEIGAITRGLKALAKELDIPVVALSQLSRQPERRGGDHRPQLADLRECVTGDTLVVLADGRRLPVGQLVGQAPKVVAVSAQGKLETARCDQIWKVGCRPVVELRLASGRRIRTTHEHRLLGAKGWRKASDFVVGDRIALARRLPEPEETISWTEERLALLGQLVGDGSYLSGQPLRYTTASEENSAAVRGAAEREFGAKVTRYAGRGRWHQLLLSGNGNRWHPAGVNRWLRELGIFGQRSHEKRLPEEVFRLSNRQIGLLLRHLWATDGTVHLRRRDRARATIVFFSSSRDLVCDVAALLLRLGIVGRIGRVEQGEYRPMFTVSVSGAVEQLRFATEVGGFGPRRAAIDELRRRLVDVKANTNVDTLPQEIFTEVKRAMAVAGISGHRMAALRGTVYSGPAQFSFAPSRKLVGQYAELLKSDRLHAAAESDLFWDRVLEVVEAGKEDAFDISVPGPASWLADGIVSHNSGSIEQDSDLVAFIYRDEVYNKLEDESNKRLAELIIAKHRNGETGTVPLVFFGETTTFKSQSKHEGAPPF